MIGYQYLIVGGGMTADAAVRGIREVDAKGSIGIVSAEDDPPYDRPPLSKGLWHGKPLDSIWRDTEQAHVALHLGRRVVALDLAEKHAMDVHGTRIGFEKLLLATGVRPRRLPFESDQIIYFRTLADYRRLRALTSRGGRIAVIGGGFIGSEVAAALTASGIEVVMIFPDYGIGSRIFPRDLSRFLDDFYRQKRVLTHPGETVTHIETDGEHVVVHTSAERNHVVDGVVIGIGSEPNVELAQDAALEVDGGIVVDEFLRTSSEDVYAAGDVATFQHAALRRRMRVEHEDNANRMGWMAGQNMAGAGAPYRHLPFFYSDLFELGYEAVGILRADLETVSDWRQPYEKGVVYYLDEGRVVGVLLWNVWGQLDAARDLLTTPGSLLKSDLIGRLSMGEA